MEKLRHKLEYHGESDYLIPNVAMRNNNLGNYQLENMDI